MTSTITARVDAGKRLQAEEVFSEVGITLSSAVNLFICAVARTKGIPFPITTVNPVPAVAEHYEQGRGRQAALKLGLADGKYSFCRDFDKRFDEMDDDVAALFD